MIQPLDFNKINDQLTGKPINVAIMEFAEIIVNKVNEVVEDYNSKGEK